MSEDMDRAQAMGELIASSREHCKQLIDLNQSIHSLGERMDRKFEEQATKFDVKITEYNKLSGANHIQLVTYLAQMRLIKWLIVIMFPTLVALGVDRWLNGE